MSISVYLTSSPIPLVEGAEARAQVLIEEHFGSYARPIQLEQNPDGTYQLFMDTTDVGHGFSERLQPAVDALGALCSNAFRVLMREDSMSDERDQMFYGGPDPQTVKAFIARSNVEEAISQLGTSELEMQARARLGELLGRTPGDINNTSPQEAARAAIARSHYPPRPGEQIDWTQPLYDSEGNEHQLVALGGIEVVTRSSFCYVPWQRRDGKCRRENCDDMTLSNAPMSEEERARRHQAGHTAYAQLARQRA
jgi:hypothetical protein